MRTSSPPPYMKQSQEQNILRQKWGFKDPNACDALERTRHALIRILANPVAWGTFNVPQADYFLSVLEFEAGWKEGDFKSYRDFWGEHSSEEDSGNEKKVDGQAYYEKARIYLNMILNPVETERMVANG